MKIAKATVMKIAKATVMKIAKATVMKIAKAKLEKKTKLFTRLSDNLTTLCLLLNVSVIAKLEK